MLSKKQPIYPSEKKLLSDLGDRIRLARLRRDISAEALAERSSISRMTLHRIEKGEPGVAMGAYFRVLAALHLQDDVNLIAKDDVVGRRLQDLSLKRSRTSS